MSLSPDRDGSLRLTRVPLLVCVALYCVYYICDIILNPEGNNLQPGAEQALAVGTILAMGAAQALFAFRHTARINPLILLAAQVFLVCASYALLGFWWGAPNAFVVAAVLLTVRGWASWVLAAAVILGEALMWSVLMPYLLGPEDAASPFFAMYAAMIVAANGLLFFGMTRLSELVRELHATRAALAPLEVARERLRIARSLQREVGSRLTAVISAARRAGDGTGEGGAEATAVVEVARQALAQVRTVADDYRDRSLAGEVAAARTVLEAADVEVVADAAPEGLPGPVDAALAAVLRREVVAAMRGVPPRHCRIELDGSELDGTEPGDAVRMRVRFTRGEPKADPHAPDGIAHEVEELGGWMRHDDAPTTHGVEVRIPVGPHRHTQTRARRPVAAAPWLAWAIMVVLELDILVATVARLGGAWHYLPPTPTGRALLVVGSVVLLSLLQVHHVRPRDGHAPPAWRWTLALQVVLVCATAALGSSSFLAAAHAAGVAGVALFHLRRPWSWALAGGLLASMAVAQVSNMGLDVTPTTVAAQSLWALMAMFAVNALCRLPLAAARLITARQELARLAVIRERVRIARDTHDLLGFQLSAIILKAELARRLARADPRAARTHLAEAGDVAEQALGSLLSITGEPAGLSFTEEVAGARSMLAAAGIDARIDLRAQPGPGAESPLAIVLREAVTNVVRHSRATTCEIETSSLPGAVRLRVTNDGVPVAPNQTDAAYGNGLANLRARTLETGGRLSVDSQADRFTLVAEIRTAERTLPLRSSLLRRRSGLRQPDYARPAS